MKTQDTQSKASGSLKNADRLKSALFGNNRHDYENERENIIAEIGYDAFRELQNSIFAEIAKNTDTELPHKLMPEIAEDGTPSMRVSLNLNEQPQQGEHSALPWQMRNATHGWIIRANNSELVVMTRGEDLVDEANAKLIVASVNHADKLADALRAVLEDEDGADDKADAALAAWEGVEIAAIDEQIGPPAVLRELGKAVETLTDSKV